jgi:hypothetical protein
VSSLTSATFASTPELVVSSINGQEYLPGGVPANLDVSTLTAATYVSTPEITVSTLTAGQISSAQLIASSINGQAFSNNLTLSSLTVANRMIASTLNINTISSVNRIDFGGFASIQGTGTSLYLANVSNIEPPSGTDMLINQSAPGRLLLGGRNGEVSLNIGVRISTTGTVMQFVQESGNNVGKIIGLDSINNIPITSLNSPNLSISTLTAANYVSTPQLIVSSINGTDFTPLVSTVNAISTTAGLLKAYQPIFEFKDGFTYGVSSIGVSTLAATSSLVARATLTTTSSCVIQATANFNVKALTNAHTDVSYYLNVNGTNTPAQMITTDNATDHLMNAGVIGIGNSTGAGDKTVSLFAWTADGANTVQVSTVQLYATTNLLQV